MRRTLIDAEKGARKVNPPIIFLDFDGVLHGLGEPALDENFQLLQDNPNLFCWRPILEKALAPHPAVRLIVASDWRRLFDDLTLSRLLGERLGPRFVGAVESYRAVRSEEIIVEAERRGLTFWLAIDDHPSVVEAEQAGDGRFIGCPPDKGLSDVRVQEALVHKLEDLMRRFNSASG